MQQSFFHELILCSFLLYTFVFFLSFAYGCISDGIPGKTHRQKNAKQNKEHKYEGEGKQQMQRVQGTEKNLDTSLP